MHGPRKQPSPLWPRTTEKASLFTPFIQPPRGLASRGWCGQRPQRRHATVALSHVRAECRFRTWPAALALLAPGPGNAQGDSPSLASLQVARKRSALKSRRFAAAISKLRPAAKSPGCPQSAEALCSSWSRAERKPPRLRPDPSSLAAWFPGGADAPCSCLVCGRPPVGVHWLRSPCRVLIVRLPARRERPLAADLGQPRSNTEVSRTG